MISTASVAITRVRFELARGSTMTSTYVMTPSAAPITTATNPAGSADQPALRVRSHNTYEQAIPIPPVAKFTTPLLRYMSTSPSADSAISDPAPSPSSSSVMFSATRYHRSDRSVASAGPPAYFPPNDLQGGGRVDRCRRCQTVHAVLGHVDVSP